jgi:hypothetical protein
MEALSGLSAGIEMRKNKQSSFCELIIKRRIAFSEMLIYLMPAVLAKGGLMKILGEGSLQPARESRYYYTGLDKKYKSSGAILGRL